MKRDRMKGDCMLYERGSHESGFYHTCDQKFVRGTCYNNIFD